MRIIFLLIYFMLFFSFIPKRWLQNIYYSEKITAIIFQQLWNLFGHISHFFYGFAQVDADIESEVHLDELFNVNKYDANPKYCAQRTKHFASHTKCQSKCIWLVFKLQVSNFCTMCFWTLRIMWLYLTVVNIDWLTFDARAEIWFVTNAWMMISITIHWKNLKSL